VLETYEVVKEREMELYVKNEQLMIEVTNCISNIQQQTQLIKSLEAKQEDLETTIFRK
jgi:hypothetical protein